MTDKIGDKESGFPAFHAVGELRPYSEAKPAPLSDEASWGQSKPRLGPRGEGGGLERLNSPFGRSMKSIMKVDSALCRPANPCLARSCNFRGEETSRPSGNRDMHFRRRMLS
jgi:hypothetical protein